MLADWWYLTKEIASVQKDLDNIGRKSSKKLSKLYRKRKRRFRDIINKIIADFIRLAIMGTRSSRDRLWRFARDTEGTMRNSVGNRTR